MNTACWRLISVRKLHLFLSAPYFCVWQEALPSVDKLIKLYLIWHKVKVWMNHKTFRLCGNQPNFIKSFLKQLTVCTVKSFIQQVSMEYLFVPVHRIFFKCKKGKNNHKIFSTSNPKVLNSMGFEVWLFSSSCRSDKRHSGQRTYYFRYFISWVILVI